jgi:hypothetical protein
VVDRELDWYYTITRVGRHYSILQYTSVFSAVTEHLYENGESISETFFHHIWLCSLCNYCTTAVQMLVSCHRRAQPHCTQCNNSIIAAVKLEPDTQ